MIKTPVITTPEYVIYTEQVGNLCFVHMDVLKWTPSIKKRFLKEWTEWAKDKELYAMPFIDDDKMFKWSILTGFELIKNHRCTDGKVRKLYWRYKHG